MGFQNGFFVPVSNAAAKKKMIRLRGYHAHGNPMADLWWHVWVPTEVSASLLVKIEKI